MLKTYTFYININGNQVGIARRLSIATLKKRGATSAYYKSIDTNAPSRGFFNKQKISI